MKKSTWLKLILMSATIIAILILLIQNRKAVQLEFLIWETGGMPQSFVLAITFALGVLCGIIVNFIFSAQANKK